MLATPRARSSSRRIFCIALLVFVVIAIVSLSVLWLPMYYYLVNEWLPVQSVFRPRNATSRAIASPAQDAFAHTESESLPPPGVTKPEGPLLAPQHNISDAATAPPLPAPIAPVSQAQLDQHKETLQSGHGVSADAGWRQRRPRNVSDEELVESEYLMDRDTMHKIADKDQYIMVTWANNHYFEFVQNWVEHIEELGISAYVVGAMDNKILGRLVRSGMPCFAMQSGLTSKDYGWGSKNFHAMGRKKIKLVQLFTDMNLTVVISDVDTVWLRNPFEYFKRYPEADILTSSDHLTWTHEDEGLEDYQAAGAAYNIGIMMFSPRSRMFAAEWVSVIERDDKYWDQNAFNDLVKRDHKFPAPDDPLHAKRLFRGARGTLVVGVLPVALFASGHTFFVSRLHEQLGLAPYVVHATFQYSGTPGKRNRFREFMLWNDPPHYYDPGHALVTWDVDLPPALLAAAAPDPPSITCCDAQQGHFDLVNHQLRQFRHGMAIASALKAGVIVPQFIAGQDRWWAPHMGRLPGATKTPLPYRAPLDHILDLERGLGRRKDEATHGPNVPYREYSFLQNPRTPAHVREIVVLLEVCPEGDTADCADGSEPARVADGAIRLRAGLTDKQLAIALGGVAAEYKVLRFRNVTGSFSQHEDREDANRFNTRMRELGSLWCCVRPPPNKAGHVWWDVMWDIVPHTDMHNRNWKIPWHIRMGP